MEIYTGPLAGEKFRQIPGWEGLYEVSNLGRVKSVARLSAASASGRRYRKRARILSPGEDARGYRYVWLYASSERVCEKIHRLVARAWVAGETALARVVHFRDGDRHNLRADNLMWVSPRANNELSARQRESLRGSQKPTAKLIETDILPVVAAWDAGATIHDLAREHGVSDHTIRMVLLGETWRHIPREPRPLGRNARLENRAPNAKLTPSSVREIRQRYRQGASCGDLAREHGVDRSTIANAVAGRTWKNV